MTLPYCTIGNISIDDLVFPDGTTMWCVPGGNSVYSALGIALWGERPSVIAPVGPEYPHQLVESRIDLSTCRPMDRTLRNWGLYEEDGSRIFTFRNSTKNWLEFSPDHSDIAPLKVEHVHVAPLRWALQLDFVQTLRASGARTISVDCDDRYLSELSREDLLALLHQIDMFLPSRQDVEALLPGVPMLDALRHLRDAAPDLPVIAIKLGAEGVIMHPAGSSDYFAVPAIAKDIVDATGAGDAFAGGALLGYSRTGQPIDALLFGSASASFAVAAMGPGALVEASREEAESRRAALAQRISVHAF